VTTTKRTSYLIELIEKDGYKLTPIEEPFYNALRDTGLTFAVQPWVQGTDRRYRVDFIVFHEGRSVAVELDGHDWRAREQTEKGLAAIQAARGGAS
jgi:very-short-patch-repair endonuclease